MTLRSSSSLLSLVLACGLWAAVPAVRAQEPHPPVTQEHTPATQSTATPAHAAPGHDTAAHHGPEVKLFGMSLGPGGQFAVKVVNFAIFFFGLFFLLKGALSSAFKTRTRELQDQLSQAERDRAQGEAQIRELDARMAELQQELDGIMVKAQTDADAEKQRILEAARQEAEQILAQTKQEIDSQKRMAELELRSLVAGLAVEGAAARLKTRVEGSTAEAVLDRSIAQVGGIR